MEKTVTQNNADSSAGSNSTDGLKYPLLSHIDSPADLRKLPVDRLPAVCSDIRAFLIDSLSRNPGHFASSMGSVELTVALHYVFNTPYDRIVWDVGHQAYGHKLLTGRRDRFATNRKLGGLSGFPNPSESPYDTFSAGHASNSISAALGMAVASQLKKDEPQRNVIAVIGDASISAGLAFEGLNNAANTPNDLLIILNDNDMSIDPNVGSLNSYLAHITTSKSYNTLRNNIYRTLKKLHLVTERQRGPIMRFNNSLKSLLAKQQNIFEGLNIRYFGPIDGHDVERIVRVLNDIKDMKGPRLLHLRTVKGKGMPAAEANPSVWHAPGRFDPATGKIIESPSSPKGTKFQDVFGSTLLELARKDEKIVGITAAMSSGTSMSIMQQEFPERVFDVGIAEGHAVTFAGGLAKEGLRPFVAIYSSFLQRAFDHIIHDVAIQHLPVTFCIDRAGLVGEDGVTHHGVFDLAYLRPIPGITIASPRDESHLRDLLALAASGNIDGPMAIRYPRGAGHDADWESKPAKQLTPGRGELLTDGDHGTVISIGPIAYDVSKAVDLARENCVDVALYDAMFLKPLDDEMMTKIARRGRPVVTVEDGVADGGLGSAVEEWLNDHGYTTIPVYRIGVPDQFIEQGSVSQLRALCGMDVDSIAETIIRACQ